MSADASHKSGDRSGADTHDTVGDRLRAALDIEDEIGSGVYQDYMNRQYWPEELDDETFLEIRQRLTVLVEDTEKHKKILQALVREHGSDK
ncbi:MAG: hypothetical protein JSW27_24480 [Phycisphaerales bacterium]|nr:MAG: hypothetical protein JSW27_24480 [Phycisphaerales bacterium]